MLYKTMIRIIKNYSNISLPQHVNTIIFITILFKIKTKHYSIMDFIDQKPAEYIKGNFVFFVR